MVVSYRNSTSNHNGFQHVRIRVLLYLIEILHQTTTVNCSSSPPDQLYLIEILHQTTTLKTGYIFPNLLYLIEILHQTTTRFDERRYGYGCILSKFYIKPQPEARPSLTFRVVSYRNSTSNHNVKTATMILVMVVSYRNSTSNHNNFPSVYEDPAVVSYRNSTSNHNRASWDTEPIPLYLIEILHQTTTVGRQTARHGVLYLIEILHQTTTLRTWQMKRTGCILSKFYIKPQHPQCHFVILGRCILSKFYIKPQLMSLY